MTPEKVKPKPDIIRIDGVYCERDPEGGTRCICIRPMREQPGQDNSWIVIDGDGVEYEVCVVPQNATRVLSVRPKEAVE